MASVNVKILTILCAFAILTLCASSAIDQTSDAKFRTSLGSFSQHLFGELFKANSHKNLIISPFVIQTCLAMTRMGADGSTAVEMDQGLGFTGQTPQSVADNYHTLLAKYEDGKHLKIVNKVYVMQHSELEDNFSEVLSKKFLSQPESINFVQADKAANAINQWVESKTNHKIKEVISKADLGVDTRLVLLSALHFKAEWEIPFPQPDTREGDFYSDESNAVRVQMMQSIDMFEMATLKDLASRAVRMPFKDSDLSMLIILPDSRTGLAALEEKLRNTPLKSMQGKLSKTRVQIILPKFKDEFEIELKDTLKEMGMKKMFSENAEFGKMLKSNDDLFVSKVYHKTYISVNEIGCEAAGVAGSVVQAMSMPAFFSANHPFYYAIITKDFVPLFQGTVVTLPESKSPEGADNSPLFG